ncbi:MAG: nitrate- and nitrite sensing domain-containing protein [Candidatus Cloacimonadota bacterium]|nr:nitrate- and nitrite sensing domain-containing protein [Candidatus Cloacimonadota bacterium]
MNFKNLKLSTKVMIITLIPIIIVIIGSASVLISQNNTVVELHKVKKLTKLAEKVSAVVHELQKERGRSAMFIGSNGTKSVSELPQQRKLTDEKAKILFTFLENFEMDLFEEGFFDKFNVALTSLKNRKTMRNGITALNISLPKALGYYTTMNGQFLLTLAEMNQLTSNPLIKKHIGAYSNFLLSKERAGIERAVGSATFAADSFAKNMFAKFASLVQAQNTYTSVFKTFATVEQLDFYDKTLSGKPIDEVSRMRKIAFENGFAGNFNIDSEYWFQMITKKINLLKTIENKLGEDLILIAEKTIKDAQFMRNLFILLFLFAILLTVVMLLYVRTIPKSINKITELFQGLTQDIIHGSLKQKISSEGVIIDFQQVIKNTNAILNGFQKMIDNINIPYFIVDKNDNVKYANIEYLKMIKKSFAEIENKKYSESKNGRVIFLDKIVKLFYC